MRLFFCTILLAVALYGCGAPDSSSTAQTTALPETPTNPVNNPPPTTIPATALPSVAASATTIPTATTAAPTKEPAMPKPTSLTPVAGLISPVPTPGQSGAAPPNSVLIAAPYEAGIQRTITLATSDLGQRLGVDPAQIEVVEVRSVVWPNSSMGCPQPGMNYKQVLIDGLFIELRTSGQIYHYHTGNDRGPFLCEVKG